MKIFDWVHRRFSHKDAKVAENGNSDEKPFSLENNAFLDAFGGWNGGILTIGTFGYDPLKDHEDELLSDDVSFYEQDRPQKDQLGNIESDNDDRQITDSDDDEEEEEVSPLFYAACNARDYRGFREFDDAILKNTDQKARTTLAELFSADSQELHEKQMINKGEIIKEKSTNCYKNRVSFARKLIGGDVRPIHKLQRLMRRMLKRKVHPEMGVNKCCTNASASLFPTQDANI